MLVLFKKNVKIIAFNKTKKTKWMITSHINKNYWILMFINPNECTKFRVATHNYDN